MSGRFGDYEDDGSSFGRFDPSTNFENVPSAPEMREKLHIQRDEEAQEMLQAAQKKKKSLLTKLYGTQIGVALASALIAAGLLYWINPPLTQKKRKDELTAEKQDWRKALFVCILVLVLVFVGPEIFRLVGLFK